MPDIAASPTTSATPAVRLVLADDHPLMLRALMALVANETNLRVVATASDGELALEAVRRFKPDMLVVVEGLLGFSTPVMRQYADIVTQFYTPLGITPEQAGAKLSSTCPRCARCRVINYFSLNPCSRNTSRSSMRND